MPNGLFYLYSLDRSISYTRVYGKFLLLSCFIEISKLNANSVDPDQTPRSAASDLGLHCLPVSLLWDARHKWVNFTLSFDSSSEYYVIGKSSGCRAWFSV